MVEQRKIFFSPGASVHISGLHLYAFLSPNLNFCACRSKMLNVTLIHRTNSGEQLQVSVLNCGSHQD